MSTKKTEVVVDGVTYHRLTKAQQDCLSYFRYEGPENSLRLMKDAHRAVTYDVDECDMDTSSFLYVFVDILRELAAESKELQKEEVEV